MSRFSDVEVDKANKFGRVSNRNMRRYVCIRNCAFILYCLEVIASYFSKVADFNLPHLHLAPPLGVTPFEFRVIFGDRKLGLRYCVALLV